MPSGPIAAETRRTSWCVDGRGRHRLLGARSAGDRRRVAGVPRPRSADLLDGVAVVVLAGSLPRRCGRRLRDPDRGSPTAGDAGDGLDADGPALRAGLAAGPAVVKPNRTELAAGHRPAVPHYA